METHVPLIIAYAGSKPKVNLFDPFIIFTGWLYVKKCPKLVIKKINKYK